MLRSIGLFGRRRRRSAWSPSFSPVSFAPTLLCGGEWQVPENTVLFRPE
jgi:hypothetical protein